MKSARAFWLVWIAIAIAAASAGGCTSLFLRDPGMRPDIFGNMKPLPRSDAIAEIDSLVVTLEHVHPNPYFLRTREEVDADRRRIIDELPQSLTLAEWWLRLAPFVAALGDGHTSLPYPLGVPLQHIMEQGRPESGDTPQEAADRAKNVPVFPADVVWDDQRHLIVANVYGAESGIAAGDRILTLNGRAMDELAAEWIREVSGDTEANRAAWLLDDFRIRVQIHGIRAPYVLDVVGLDRRMRNVTLTGISGDALHAARVARAPAQAPPPAFFSYGELAPGIGYMNFFSMGELGESGSFAKEVDAMFRRIASSSVRTLIVDLRNNGGGEQEFSKVLLNHMTDKPYRIYAAAEIKRSRELRSWGKSYMRASIRWLPLQYLFHEGRILYSGPEGSIAREELQEVPPEKSEPFFSGPVCFLTGPKTFSAAAELADVVKTYRLGVLIGEETGGVPSGFSNSGYEFVLPHSRMSVGISGLQFIRANGDANDRRPVMPDIVVHRTAADIGAGRDPVLERARRCPN